MPKTSSMHPWLKAVTYIGIYGGLLMPLFFWPVVIFPFVFSKLAFFQVLIGLTFPAYLVLAWSDPRFRPRTSMLYIAVAAYFTAIGLSALFSVDVTRSWWGNQERMNGMFTLLHFFAWLTMAVGTLKRWPDWRRLLNYEVGLSAFMAIVAILQKPFPSLLGFTAGPRVGGLLDNPIYMGSYQIFNLFFIALLWLKTRDVKMRVFYGIVAAFDITAFVLAQSRGALLGLGVGVIVFGLAFAFMTPKRKVRQIALGLLVLAFAGYGTLYAFRNTELISNSPLARFTNLQASTRTRLIAWDIAWKGFLERPLTGSGIDTFHVTFNKYYNPESLRYGYYETWFDRAHNTIMDVLSMTGALGFITFAAMYVILFVTVIRAYRNSWIDPPTASMLLGLPVGYFVQNLFVFDHPAAFSMSYLLFAFVIAIDSPSFGMARAEDDWAPGTAKTLTTRYVSVFIVLEIAAAFLVWRATIQPFRASMYAIRSNKAFVLGKYEESFTDAKKAFSIPSPYLDEQSFLHSRNFMSLVDGGRVQEIPFWRDWHDLIFDISEAQAMAHPLNAHPRFIYARLADATYGLVESDRAVAEREYTESIKLSPKRQQLYYSYARFLIRNQQFEGAEALLREAISFDEEIGEGHWVLGLTLMFDQGRKDEGAEEMRKAFHVEAIYEIRDVREIVALALAYDHLGDTEGLKGLMKIIAQLPAGSMDLYLDIARVMEKNGLQRERDAIVAAVARADATMNIRLTPLFAGAASTIDEALRISASEGYAPSSSGTTEGTATGTTPGTGPRR